MTVQQTATTTAGQIYDLSLHGTVSGGSNSSALVTTSSGLSETVTFTGAPGDYTTVNITFTATPLDTIPSSFISTQITLSGDAGFNSNAIVDSVSLRPVVGTTLTATEDVPLEISNIVISQSAGTPVTVTLSADVGILTVKQGVPRGVSNISVTNNGTYVITLTGTADEINATLNEPDGLIYTGNANSVGADQIVVSVNDGATTLSETLAISVLPVSDAIPANNALGLVVTGAGTLNGVQFYADAGEKLGQIPAGIGDINGDGITDFIVGAQPTWSSEPGRGFVIYGQSGVDPWASFADAAGAVNVNDVASNGGGFELIGEAAGNGAGFAVTGGGDINNDGIADIMVGAIRANSNAGQVYVIYGGQDFATITNTNGEVNLSAVGGSGALAGLSIIGSAGAGLGWDLSNIGDFNGDGIDDMLVGGSKSSGEAWVIFGGQDFSTIVDANGDTNTANITIDGSGGGLEGFRLTGTNSADGAGKTLEMTDDFNGDG